MSGVADPRALLARYGLRAKKSWGQNFLISERVYAAIADAVVAAPDDWIVEIGAGLGTLTARLAARVPDGKVIAVERDRDMATVLRGELGAVANVDILEADAKQLDYAALAARRGGPLAVCGNLPYQLTAPLVFAIVEQRAAIARAVVMVQREVAERMAAPPGSKTYGALSVMVQARMAVSTVIRAAPGAFFPPPKVESAVVRLDPIDRGIAGVDGAGFSAVVHAAFGQRRKTLRNALKARFDLPAVDAALAACGIDGGRRGETLSVQELAALAQELTDAGAA